jgi:SAM-dependent methyltransferase
VFAEIFSRIVVPRAEPLGIFPSNAAGRCSVRGQFDDEGSTIAYCMAYAWMHFASFKSAIDVLGVLPSEFPQRPLVVDIGCGPGTAVAAFGEWLSKARNRRADIRYVGIDRSEHMRALAGSFSTDPTVFEDHLPVLLPSAEGFTQETATSEACGRDGIVLTMSYVLHQDFMADGHAFRHVVRMLSHSRLPIWVLAQDANKPVPDEANVDIWPETRLRALLNATEAFGYRSRIWHRNFEAMRYKVDEQGCATEQLAVGRKATKAIAARLFPA